MRNSLTGELEGYCIDLLKELSVMMGFTYDEPYIVEDRNYGNLIGSMWNGIIGDIVQKASSSM